MQALPPPPPPHPPGGEYFKRNWLGDFLNLVYNGYQSAVQEKQFILDQ